MSINTYLLTFVFGVLGLVATAQETLSFSLDEAKDHALKNNEQLKQANIDLAIAQAKVKETTAIGLPQISGEATFNYFIDIPVQLAEPFDLGDDFNNWIGGVSAATGIFFPVPDPNVEQPLQEFQFGLPFSASAGLTVSQLLFDGSYIVGLQASRAYKDYAALGIEKTEIEVKNSVAQTYFSAVSIKETIKSLEENKASIAKSSEETQALLDAGFVETQDANQLKLALSNIEYQLDFSTRSLQSIKNLLKMQMGVPQESTIELTSEFDDLVETYGTEASLIDQGFNMSNHIDFRTIDQGEQLQELAIKAEQTTNMPSLATFFNHSQNGFSQEFGDIFSNTYFPTTIVGLQLNVPIFSSGMRYYKTKQSKLELEKIQSQKSMLEQSLNLQATSAKADYESAIQNMEVAKENLSLADDIKQNTDAKYKEGLASSLDFAQSQQQYLQTLAQYINAANEVFKSKLALEQALGIN